jgi:hypothetical protein
VSPNNAAVIRDRLPAGVFCDRRDRIRGSFGAGFGFVVLAIEQKVASNMGIGIGLRVVEDEGVLTMPWSATETYRRLLGEWPEHVRAENPHAYYGTDTAVPTADKPDF